MAPNWWSWMDGSREPIRVLHVEDEPEFAETAAIHLQGVADRFDIEVVGTVSEGLERLENGDFHCIISDYELPDRTGVEFLKAVRADATDLPFILYTAKGSEEIASEAISAGVTDYLEKESGTSQFALLANRIENAVDRYLARRTADRTEERMRLLAENTDDILWMYTADWEELLFINSAYEDIWGRSIEELREFPPAFQRGVHPDDRSITRAAMDRLSSGEKIDIEFRVNADEGYRRWVWVKGSPVFDEGTVTKVTGFARDVTEWKRREEDLERQNARLDEFTSVVSHDLRSPLNVATGRLSMVADETDSDHVETAVLALERMETLIDDLLTLARAGEMVGDVEVLELADVVDGCWATVATNSAELVVETEQEIRADGNRLRQLLENLFTNAVCYGGETVAVTVGDLSDGFYVEDDGPGIPPEDRERVFEPGFSSDEDSTGYGLSIVQDIAEAHGWTVEAVTGTEGGARFELRDVTVER